MSLISRFELKYRISMWQYYQIRNALTPYMRKDDYTQKARSEGYLVRSLYFDTENFHAYRQKKAGEFSRIKLRIRSYAKSASEKPPVRVEIKTRRGSLVEKHSTFVDFSAYCAFMKCWHWPELSGNTLIEFERILHMGILRPKVLIDYQREGYVPRIKNDNLRVTFDHNVRSASAISLFQDKFFFRSHSKKTLLIEIKCAKDQPDWLKNIIRQHTLRSVPNSKYAQAVEISKPAFVISPTF